MCDIYKNVDGEWVLAIYQPHEIFHRDSIDEILEIVKDKLENGD